MRRLKVVDLFCGAGGTSGGVYEAAEKLGEGVDLVAVNHWDVAIATHSKNHTHARHLCESLESVRPRTVVPGGYLDLLIASPECTHHSTARGGVPMSEQSRSTAWSVLTWAQHLYVKSIIIENVPEFVKWGPLGSNRRPLLSKKGETFRAFIKALESLGYTVDYRVLCAADYGDATERRRLFIMARRGRGPVSWPRPTHQEHGRGLPVWRSFEDHVWDRSIVGQSIFTRRKQLARKTLLRIGAGIEEFAGLNITKFLVKLNGTGRHRAVDRPVPTITAGGKRLGLVELRPFLLGQHSGGKARAGRPVPTIAADGAVALAQPFLVPNFGERKGQKARTRDTRKPLPAVTSHGAGGLVQPFAWPLQNFVIPAGGPQFKPRSGKRPLGTVLTRDHVGVASPFLVEVNHGDSGGRRIRSAKRPVPTVAGSRGLAVTQAFLVQFNGTSKSRSMKRPIGSLTTKQRYAVIEIGGKQYGLEILFRMLHWRELARAMSFPEAYQFVGTGEQIVKQIGNAVPRWLAAALCREQLRRVR